MINYFRTEITNSIDNAYSEHYTVGVCGDNWNTQDAREFLKVWTDEFDNISAEEDFECNRSFKEPEMCTKSQFEECWIRIEDFQIITND